jgi:hypothetical protein
VERNIGCKVDLFGETYFFHARPELTNGNTAHVCQVTERCAIDRLLAMPEHFNQYGKPPLSNDALVEIVERRRFPALTDRDIHETWIDEVLAQPSAVFSNELQFHDQQTSGSC